MIKFLILAPVLIPLFCLLMAMYVGSTSDANKEDGPKEAIFFVSITLAFVYFMIAGFIINYLKIY